MLIIQLSYLWQKFRLFFLLILTIGLIIACQNNTPEKLDPNTKHSSKDCRVISHSMGETCVPKNPQRVVMLSDLDNALVLGIKPVGATVTRENLKFRTGLIEQTKGIESVGVIGEPSLETIAQLKPDLILLSYPKKNYELLSKIAPTVLFAYEDEAYKSWKDKFRAYANVLGKTQAANEILNAYQQRVTDFQQAMGDRLTDTEVSLVNFFANDVRIYLKKFFAGEILEDVGLPRPPAQDKNKRHIYISLETIPQMAEGDVMFLILGNHEKSNLERFTNHPLWSQLEAVQQGKIYQVNNQVWISGETPVAANLVLDDLFKYLVEENFK